MNGIALIDKPSGITSFGVVSRIRRQLKIKKVGHGGTLDPLATGLLILLLGEDTKLFSRFSAFDKAYEATLELGVATTTGDCQGKIIEKKPYDHLSEQHITSVFSRFTGNIQQIPPMFSALKYQGKKLYEFARRGIEVPRKSREVTIRELHITRFHLPYIDFFMHCSKGTYVRSLAHDIGQEFGCGACIVQIRRVSIGPFHINDSVPLQHFNESYIRHWTA